MIMEYEFVLNSVKYKLFLVSIVKIIKMIIRFFFINILTQKKLLLLNRKNCTRKISNVSYFGKKNLCKKEFLHCDDLCTTFIIWIIFMWTHPHWVGATRNSDTFSIKKSWTISTAFALNIIIRNGKIFCKHWPYY